MRRARIKADGAGYYHCMSRIIERRQILSEAEKQRLYGLMHSLAAFGGLNVLTYALMSNHFHVLVHVPAHKELGDAEFLKRLAFLFRPDEVRQIGQQLQDFRQHGQDQAAEALKGRYTYRMENISEFCKALKQRFSQSYNVRAGRNGPLWEQRFKSILIEGSEHALLAVAAYIDLNPVRAGLAADPKDYRFCGYGEAVGGSRTARLGLRKLMEVSGPGRHSWGDTQRAYRQQLYGRGAQRGVDPAGKPIRSGFTPQQVQQVIDEGGRLPMHEVLRCRVRYFADGVALGSAAFLETVFQRYRGQFGPRRQTGARPMRFGDWGGLCTLRDLRLQPVSRACA